MIRGGIIFIFLVLNQWVLGQNKLAARFSDTTTIVIDSLKVTGNKHLNEEVVFAESRLRIGERIKVAHLRDELFKSRRNLLNTKLFNDVEILIYHWQPNNHISIDFQVDERWYIYPIPTLGLNGITFKEWREEFKFNLERVTYGLDIKDYNLTKQGDPLRLKFTTGFENNIEVDYFYPRLRKDRTLGIGFDAMAHNEKGASIRADSNKIESVLFNDVAFRNRGASVRLRHRRDINNSHELKLGYNKNTVSQNLLDSVSNYLPGNKDKLNYMEVDYQGTFEHRDLKEYPLFGHYSEINLNYRGLGQKDYTQLYLSGRYNYYRPLREKLFASTSFLFRYTPLYEDDFYSLSNFRINSERSPRGFNNYQLFPASYFTSKNELRYRLMDRKLYNIPILPDRFEPVPMKLYPKAFFDMSKMIAAQKDVTNELNDKFLFSGGLGMDVVTIYNTIIRLELSENNLGETKFNIALGKPF